MQKINKSFGANRVLRDVDFSLGTGEICALLGENGAGKSTLMNILGGVLPADSGTICLDGKEVHFTTPLESLDAGVGFIHQELNLINDLTIYENMFLTHLPHKGCLLDKALMRKKTKELFERMNLELDPNTMVRELQADRGDFPGPDAGCLHYHYGRAYHLSDGAGNSAGLRYDAHAEGAGRRNYLHLP